MYLFAFLFTIGCIYNLVTADYVEAVGSAAVAIILGACKFYWDSTEGLSRLNRLRIAAVTTFFVLAFSFVTIKILREIEIGSEKYAKVSEIRLNFPELNGIIRNIMEDGKISIVEYRYVLEQCKKQRKIKER